MLLLLAMLLSTTAAALNAGSSVLQRFATRTPSAREMFSRQFTAQVLKNRLFIIGIGLQVVGFFAQAFSLNFGPISLVQPLLTLDLVFLLIFIRKKVGVTAGAREWGSVAAICIGLAGLFVAARPRGGTYTYNILVWSIIIALMGAWIVSMIFIVRRMKSPRVRAMLAASAAAVSFSLNAVSTKLALHQLTTGGPGEVITGWPVYMLMISGCLSLYLMQNTYGAGPLAISQPVVEIGEPAISVTLGILVFGETIRLTPPAIAGELMSAIVLTIGIIGLAGSPKLHQAGKKGL